MDERSSSQKQDSQTGTRPAPASDFPAEARSRGWANAQRKSGPWPLTKKRRCRLAPTQVHLIGRIESAQPDRDPLAAGAMRLPHSLSRRLNGSQCSSYIVYKRRGSMGLFGLVQCAPRFCCDSTGSKGQPFGARKTFGGAPPHFGPVRNAHHAAGLAPRAQVSCHRVA